MKWVANCTIMSWMTLWFDFFTSLHERFAACAAESAVDVAPMLLDLPAPVLGFVLVLDCGPDVVWPLPCGGPDFSSSPAPCSPCFFSGSGIGARSAADASSCCAA